MEKSLLWGDEIPIGKFFRAHRRSDLCTELEPVLNAGPLLHGDSGYLPDAAPLRSLRS